MNKNDDFEFQLRAQQQLLGGSGGIATYVDPTDNTVYEWDEEKRAWFPKVQFFYIMHSRCISAGVKLRTPLQITDDFLAAYQAQYGVYEPPESTDATTGVAALPTTVSVTSALSEAFRR